ncbi:hypothetical protein Tco_1001496, partial [Tanacetum coccineum]
MSVRELLLQEKLHKALQAVYEKLNQQEQASNVSTHTLEPSRRFNFIYDDDDDDEESTIPLNEIISQIPPSIAITPVLPTMEPEDSLIMGDENLSTIPEKESNEFIKSSVEDLVLIPSESEDTPDSDKECDLPFCDNSVTFFNPLFDANDDECFDPGCDILLDRSFYLEHDILFLNMKHFALILKRRNYPEIDLLLSFPSGNEDIIFDLGIFIIKRVQSKRFQLFPLDDFPTLSFVSDSLLLTDPSEIENFLSFPSGNEDKIPSGESKVHIEVLSVLWGNRLSIPDGSLPLS